MEYLTLSEIKQHLNIDTAFTDDDNYLYSLGDVAETAVARHIDCPLEELVSYEGVIPAPIKQAMLLMIGTFYATRESVTSNTNQTEVPLAYQYLLQLYHSYKKYAD